MFAAPPPPPNATCLRDLISTEWETELVTYELVNN